MLISATHDFVFLCTPKCASNSIEDMLRPYTDIALVGPPAFRHTNFRAYSKYLKPYLKETRGDDRIETICVVREPLSWLNSYYRFRSRIELRNPQHPNHRNSTHGIRFDEFLRAYLLPDQPPYARVGSQFDFVRSESNEVGVDRIFRYEDMDEFLDYMSHKVGRKLKMDFKNVSPKVNQSNLMEMADSAKRKIISRLNIKPAAAERAEFELPDDLLASLRRSMPRDFELYENLKSPSHAA